MSSASSTCVYVPDKIYGWLPGNIIENESNSNGIIKVQVTKPKLLENPITFEINENVDIFNVEITSNVKNNLPLQNVDANGNPMILDDMVELPSLTEASILANLMARHQRNEPYTKIGDIVIAMNPFQWIEDLYSEDLRLLYANSFVWDAANNLKLKLSPHVYETSSRAYRDLAVDGVDQSILVSGESGAGKTETVKIVMSHLASIYNNQIILDDSGGNSSDLIVKRVLDSNPLLEAFGNAKTIRNDNSSRFGKYIQLEFDVEDADTAAFAGRSVPNCVLAGSQCETYLLEKSRITSHEADERTYHIFYQLLDAPDEVKATIWSGLKDSDASSFKYVGHGSGIMIEGRTDAQAWQRTSDALATIGIEDAKLVTLMKAITIVMQLGNLSFGPDPSNDENSVITSTHELKKLAELMGVSLDVVKGALTFRTVVAGKEVYKVPLNATDAQDNCDAFAKEIYQQVFNWLVKHINEATCAKKNYSDTNNVVRYGRVGLLDIFGFESFKVNRFEQLCINYTNEKLQQKYTIDVFQAVQEEYEFEGIDLPDLTYEDNADVVGLIEGRMGLIAVLNEECVRPRGNDLSFVSKIKTINKDVECLVQEKLHQPAEFGINHYAGPVKYDATFFVKKNMDSIPQDLLQCAKVSTNDLICTELLAAAHARETAGSSGQGKGRKVATTISTNFRTQLNSLMSNIESTRTRYIRCIKPNKAKQAGVINIVSSLEQLRCAGVVAAVSISRAVFPNRLSHQSALDRFECLLPADTVIAEASPVETPIEVMMSFLLKGMEKQDNTESKQMFVCGKTRVYFYTGALEYLESERLVALGKRAIVMQRIVRGFAAKFKFTTMKFSSIKLQAFIRFALARRNYTRLRDAVVRVECCFRVHQAIARLHHLREAQACIKIQCKWRCARDTTMLKRCMSSTIILQRVMRGAIQRPIFKVMLEQAKEDAKIENQLKILQQKLAEAERSRIEEKTRRIEAEDRVAGFGNFNQNLDVSSAHEEKKSDDNALIHESNEMIEYLKKEIFNLRGKNYLLRTDFVEAKNQLSILTETHSSTVSSLEALYMQVHSLQAENSRLNSTIVSQKKEVRSARSELNVNTLLNKAEKKKLTEEISRLKNSLEIAKVNEIPKDTNSSNQRPPKREIMSRSSIKQYAEVLRTDSKRNLVNQHMKRVSSTNRLKNSIKHSKEAPEGQWDRSGFDQLLHEESKKKKGDKRGSSRRSSKNSSRVVTPDNSRPQTPTALLQSFRNSKSSLASAALGNNKNDSKSSLASAATSK